jgi:hypothetical protein
MKRMLAALVGLALVVLLPSASVAVTASASSRVLAKADIAPFGTTNVLGTITADIRAVPASEVPGFYSFDGASTNTLKHARTVIERVSFWPWNDGANGWANFAFVEGAQCMYFSARAPLCTDASWAFIDYRNPAIKDVEVSCWWDNGIRPAPVTGDWKTCDSTSTSSAHQDWNQVIRGSLLVILGT